MAGGASDAQYKPEQHCIAAARTICTGRSYGGYRRPRHQEYRARPDMADAREAPPIRKERVRKKKTLPYETTGSFIYRQQFASSGERIASLTHLFSIRRPSNRLQMR